MCVFGIAVTFQNNSLGWWSKALNRSCFLSFAAFRTPSNPWDMRFRSDQWGSEALLRQAHSTQQVGVARVGVENIKVMFVFHPAH